MSSKFLDQSSPSIQEPGFRSMGHFYSLDNHEIFGKMNAQGQPASPGLLASPAQPRQTLRSYVDASPTTQFLQLNEIPLEELDLSTPKLPSDDSTAPPWLLPHVLSPRSTELAWPSTAIAIRERSPCRAALGSHHQPQSKNRDVFPASPQPPQETVPLIGGEQGQRTHQIYGPLENGICSIIKSVAGKERMIDHSNAVQLKEDLRTLLDLTESRLLCTHRADDNLGSKLNLMNHLISSASAIAINMTCSFRFPCSLLPEAHIRWEQRRTTLCVDTSILDVTRKFSLNYPVQTRRDVRISDSDGIYTGLRIAFKPKGSTFALCIEVNHCQLVDGSFSSIPRLSICNTVSSDSLVFKVAASGSVSDLMKLLTSGQAHIRDHDEDGCSLLHHSLKNPPMCQFLVQCGLDVDETGNFCVRGRTTVRTPLHISWFEWGNVETTRTLLAGGADPTIETDILVGVASCLYYYTWEDKDLTILYDVVNLCTHFGVFDVRNGLGETLFLSLFRVGKGDYDFQIGQIKGLEFLLNRGSNINDKTTSGSTCLHILFCSNLEPGWTENWLSLIIFAIQQGADVYSADIYGVTVSEIAYAKRVCYDLIADLGSYRGDVWDAALHACGYNILDFRTAYPRMARYTECYTRKDFESLWRDREHLCPYWDDNEWPATLGSNRGIIDLSTSQMHLCCCSTELEVRRIDIHSDEYCFMSTTYDDSSESSCTDICSDVTYETDDDGGDREEWEPEARMEEEGKGSQGIQDMSSMHSSDETGSSEDTAMQGFFREIDGLFDLY